MKEETKEFERNIDYVIRNVAQRGWTDTQKNIDDFAILRKELHYKNEIVVAFYEQYFLPERHEFEWEMLKEIVDEIITSAPLEFIGVSIASGVVGNIAYDLLKNLCKIVALKFKEHLSKDYEERGKGFSEIALNTEKIKRYFEENPMSRIEEIEKETGVSREKIYPILKLVGFKHYRRETPCFWEPPS